MKSLSIPFLLREVTCVFNPQNPQVPFSSGKELNINFNVDGWNLFVCVCVCGWERAMRELR